MKKSIVAGLAAGLILLAGCGQQEIYYKEKLLSTYEVEEIIADELEVENPNLDLQVNISEETD